MIHRNGEIYEGKTDTRQATACFVEADEWEFKFSFSFFLYFFLSNRSHRPGRSTGRGIRFSGRGEYRPCVRVETFA